MAEFDWEQLRGSAVLNGATDIALTFADYITAENQKAIRFERLSKETRDLIAEVEQVANAPVSLISTCFDRFGVIDRRIWLEGGGPAPQLSAFVAHGRGRELGFHPATWIA